MRLKDKVAIITGGSRGIGFATADAFLREGAKVAVAASSEKNAEAAVEKLKAIHPDAEVVGISPNLGSFESVKEEFDKVEKQFGRIDILVNNAGVSESTPFTSYTEADFDRVIDLKDLPEDIEERIDGELFFKAYHMNKKHWYTICLDGRVSDEEIGELIDVSYRLASGKKKVRSSREYAEC